MKIVIAVICGVMLGVGIAYAAGNPVAHVFQNGTIADADEVNSNFQELADRIETNSMNIANSSAVATIVCQQTGTITGGAGGYTFDFTAQECGGTLPDENYIGMGVQFDICDGAITWRVNQAPTPGVHIYSQLGPCGDYTFTTVYIRTLQN